MENMLDNDPAWRERLRLVATGEVDVDEPELATCLELTSGCVVGVSGLEHEACRRAIAGRRDVGEPCLSSAECKPDSYCQAEQSVDGACAGKCAERKPADSSCNSSEECRCDGSAYRCERGASAEGTCRAITVQTDRGLGDACGTTGVGTESSCSGTLWCAGSDSRCAEPIARDEPCIDDNDVCERGYFCAGTEGAKTCRLVTIATEQDESCNPDELQLCDLTAGLECIDGTCQSIGDGRAGTHCGVDSLNCDIGLYCNRDSDSCQPRLPASSPCTVDRECQSGTCDASKLCAADYCGVR
jgi:hypothetical protein